MAHVTGQSRYQSTLFPEVLDEVVGRDDPVRVIDAFVAALDLEGWIFQGGCGGDGTTALRAWRSFEAVYLWVLAPGAGQPAAGGGNAAQRPGDVADQPPDAGVQDHCGLPQGPRGSDREGMPGLYRVLPGAVAVRRRVVGD